MSEWARALKPTFLSLQRALPELGLLIEAAGILELQESTRGKEGEQTPSPPFAFVLLPAWTLTRWLPASSGVGPGDGLAVGSHSLSSEME